MPAKFEDMLTATRLVHELINNNLMNFLYYGDIQDWKEKNFPNLQDTFESINWGCTKVVFIPRELPDWVIKVGFRCRRTNEMNADNEFIQDFSDTEYYNYCKAKDAGVERYFAETEDICWVEGKTFYLQRRAVCSEDKVSSKFYQYASNGFEVGDYATEEDYDEEIREYIDDGMEDCEKASAILGEDESLIDFLLENQINDLHEGNFGYIGDEDHYVIVDFSGY